MRKLFVTVAVSTAVLGAAAGLPAAAEASTTAPAQMAAITGGSQVTLAAATAKAAANDPLSFSTKMISFAPIDVAPQGLSAGDGYVIAGLITRNGGSDGVAAAQCTYTITKGPVLRSCTIDYAFSNGLLVANGFINGPAQAAAVTLVVVGGTGEFANARGYGTLQPTSTGSDVTLHLND